MYVCISWSLLCYEFQGLVQPFEFNPRHTGRHGTHMWVGSFSPGALPKSADVCGWLIFLPEFFHIPQPLGPSGNSLDKGCWTNMRHLRKIP